MTNKEPLTMSFKFIALMLIVQLIVIIGACVAGFLTVKKTDNCWDKYQTEQQAIEACETHG